LDMLWSVVRCLCLVVWWFHPLVWVAFRMSVRDSELACDEGVILAIGEEEKKAYGYMLLHRCEGFGTPGNAVLPTLATEMIGGKGEMRDRIFTLTKGKKNSVLAGICALAVAVAACGCTYGKEGGKEKGKTAQEQENGIAKTKGMSGKNSARQQNQKGYYQIHSEEEIKKDQKEQVRLIHQNRNMWLIHTELDDRMMITGQAGREGDLTDLVYDKYAVSDMDQNGRLELIAFDNINGYAHFYEVEEDRSGLSECERAGDFDGAGNVGLLQNNGVFEDGTPGSYFDGEQGLWHFNIYTYDLFKKGDTVYLSGEETIGESGEGAEYYKNMIPGCACFSWFKKTYMTSDGDGYFDKYFTEEELLKELEISADAFQLMRKETGPDYKQIYTEFARFKALSDSDGRDRWYMAIADSVQPVLILANGGYDKYPDLDRRYDELMTEADVYGYDLEKKEVVRVGTIRGENLLFSLVTDGIYLEIERSTEETYERLFVTDGKGILERMDGCSRLMTTPYETGHYSKIRLDRAEGQGTDGEVSEVVLDQIEVPDYLAKPLEFYPPYYMETNIHECDEVHFTDVNGKPDSALVFSKKKMGDYTVYITSDNAKKVTDELSPHHGLYEGIYQIEVYQGEELKDLRKIYIGGEDTLYFPKKFSLAVKDYNEDGNPDFALGNRAGSNHYAYMFYSVSKWGLLDYVLDAKSEPASVPDSSGKGPSGVFSSKDKTILYQWYDQEKGKNVKGACELL
ncbi:MAG: hypothetical protein IJ733_18515, partial [Lachnospiraceae bacterium]|nr:hypothetical protein [Lachnospiraceae bacterium]